MLDYTLLNGVDSSKNFWEVNSHFTENKTILAFKKKDRSQENKVITHYISSTIMWGLCFLYDMHSDCPCRLMAFDEKIDWVEKNTFSELKDFSWDDVYHVQKEVAKMCTTTAMEHLNIINKKLKERSTFIDTLDYTQDSYKEVEGRNVLVKGTADQLDKMLIGTAKVVESIKLAEMALFIELDKMKQKDKDGVQKTLSSKTNF